MNSFVIAKRELNFFLASPTAYIIGAAFLFVTGLFFVFTITIGKIATLEQMFQVTSVLLLFLSPILTMRLLAEEAHSGTLELLMTAPVRDWEVVLGKFLAAFIFYVVMLLPTLFYLLLLTQYGNPDIAVTLSGYLGIILLGAMLISMGVLTSAVSANQIMAAVVGIVLSLTLWQAVWVADMFDGSFSTLIKYLSIQEHFYDFVRGLITLTNIVYFLSVTVISLFLSTLAVQVRRWR